MLKAFPTLKVVQRSKDNLDGNRNIFIRVTINRKSKYFPLNIYCKSHHFKNGTVTQADKDHWDKNSLIEKYSIKAKKIIWDHRITDKEITFAGFENNFYNSTYNNESFTDFFENQVELFTNKLAVNSIKNYKSQLKKLREFRNDIKFSDVNTDFLHSFEGFIKTKKGNNRNTVIKSLAILKSICSKAVDQGKLKENPFKSYKLGRIEGDRQFLSDSELNTLENIYHQNNLKNSLQRVLRYFLFCCYTGLRYQDIKKLKFKDIQDGQYIHLQMTKTKEFVRIPLIDKAKILIPEQRGFDKQAVFRVYTDQPTNRYLKEIMRSAGIHKTISFHCSRHTFATWSKSKGIPYDVISQILGHTDIKTTKIYTRYELDYLTREMNKLNT